MIYLEPKKTEKADLENKRPLIFSISLLISMSLIIVAFRFKQRDGAEIAQQKQDLRSTEEVVEVPVTEIKPPPPPKIIQPNIIEVPDEKRILEDRNVEFDINVSQLDKTPELTIFDQPVEEKEDVEQIFVIVEQVATPEGGLSSFYKYVNERLKYPAQASRMGIQGKVFIEFVVNKDGTLSNVVAVKGIGAGCDEEAVDILQNSPRWQPAKQRGKPVRQRMVLPIIFKLAGNN